MSDNETTIFYSWQSDLSSKANRNFIENALKRAAKAIRNDESINVQPRIDRDTMGTPGAVEISSTIFDKIKAADVFVADVSIINSNDVAGQNTRLVCNPNVLLELGYAMGTIGHAKIVMVFNKAFGKLEDLPFDLRGRRVAGYQYDGSVSPGDQERDLAKTLEIALRDIFAHREISSGEVIARPTLLDIAIESVESQSPLQKKKVRQYADWVIEQLDTINPFGAGWGEAKPYDSAHQIDPVQHLALFNNAVEFSSEITVGFASLVDMIAATSSEEAAIVIFEMFAKICERYNPARDFRGMYSDYNFDFFKFVGFEMFVVFISRLLLEGKWELIDRVLSHVLYVENDHEYKSVNTDFTYIGQFPSAIDLWNRSFREDGSRYWTMPIGQFMKERLNDPPFVGCITIEDFIEADSFLFFRSVLSRDVSEEEIWMPFSVLAVQRMPEFIVRSESRSYASKVSKALGLDNVATLGIELEKAISYLHAKMQGHFRLDQPFRQFDANKIGKR